MITIIYSTHKDKDYNLKFKKHLIDSVGLKDVQILEYENHNQHTLAQVYNSGITESIYNIIVCCHNDIHLEKGWGKKLLEDFSNNQEFGIIGKAGSCYFPESGVYWEKMFQTMVGQVYHHPEGQKKWLNRYSPKLPYLIPVVTIDGLFISFDKTKIKHTFDESIGRFHFYDHAFCLPNYLDSIKIGVTSSFEITHQSVGQPNEEFFSTKEKFLEKWGGYLPLDLKPNNVFVPEIKEKQLKNVGKVAVIILTKGKIELLNECVKSFYSNCSKELFDIFIADTGSTQEEKKWIKDNIIPLGNINFIEFDYYNFAKINNDVVKNYLSKDYEFILFCNNDVEIKNNVVYNMMKVFKTNPKVGTVGARLHYGDNTVQHGGIQLFFDKGRLLLASHTNKFNYFNYSTNVEKVLGNTAALMMIKKEIFESLGMFNENYSCHFEDVELNCNCIIKGYNNYCDNTSVAYHYESTTRKENKDRRTCENKDYFENFAPFILSNMKHFEKYITYKHF